MAISPRSASPSCWQPRWCGNCAGAASFEDRAEPDLFALLDLVALGTVADVAR
jgi:single-stranded DNA-specific DHH superfamily exonuclease